LPYYLNVNIDGLISADSVGDGYSIKLKWATAYPTTRSNKIAYNIYMSSGTAPDFPDRFFDVSPSFISIDGSTSVSIVDLVPGEMYHFAVRAAEYNSALFDLSTLPPVYSGLVFLPQSLLSTDISATDTTIPLVDADFFPNSGVVRIGAELVKYGSVDHVNNNLLSAIRGYGGYRSAIHTTDGYDGYSFLNPYVVFWPSITEEQNTRVFECWNRFEIGRYPFTLTDGYHQKTKDILTTNLGCSDAKNTGFPAYDFAGYHRTDPTLILSGACIGSYIGGYQGCADSNTGAGMQIRGISAQDAILQREEVLLSTTGEPVVLMKRRWTGITCNCYLPNNEYPENRCNICYGGGIVIAWEQFFDPRRSDGRIMVRFSPSTDDLIATDSGLESQFSPNCWTLPVPTLKDRDFIVRFDECGDEEFRYEILNVTRNITFLDNTGAQLFAINRIRKTDPLYQVPVYRNTSMFPMTFTTTNASSLGIPDHNHTVVINENPIGSNAQQISGISQGHSHTIFLVNGILVVTPELSHTHQVL
jgi:hypothetical protein